MAPNVRFRPIADVLVLLHDATMRVPEGSNRTRRLFWLYSAALAVALALVFWLFAILIADLLGKSWPTPPLVDWLTIAVVPLVALRLALAWSMKSDQRAS